MALRINHKDNSIQFNEAAAPATPPAGTAVLYIGVDGLLHIKSDAGADVASLTAVVEDTTPQLGGNLSVNNRTITAEPAATVTSAGNQVQLTATNGGATSGNGGAINITSGTSPTSGAAGDINITSGNSVNSASGTITLKTGTAGNNGGDVVLEMGFGTAPGNVYIATTATTGSFRPALRFVEDNSNGSNYVGLICPISIAANVTWTLPDDTHVNADGKFITSDASGVLSFSAAVENPMTADLDVSTFLVKASASTYLDLDDTTTTLHTAGALTVGSVGAISIAPDNKAGLGAFTTLAGGRSTDGTGGTLQLNGGQGVTVGGNIVLTPGSGTTEGTVQVAGSLTVSQSDGSLALDVNATEVLGGTLNDVVILDRVQGRVSNLFKLTNWVRRDATGSDWNTAVWHSAISVDTAFATPGTDTRCWEERDPNAESISFGSGATTYLTVNGTITAHSDFTVNGQLRAAIGTISLPGITFTGDNNTGIYQPSTNANEMRFACGGSNNFAIESNGTLNVAGTTNYETLVTHDDDIPNKKYVDDGDRLSFNVKTVNYTLLITDENKMITMSSTGALTLTVPVNSSVAFPIGTQILVERENTGTVTIGGSVTFQSAGGLLSLASQHSTLSLIKKATDTWLVAGDLA